MALRHTGTHDGVSVALRSNIRWYSDHLEIQARNAGISGEMVCDLMIATIERHFQALKVPHRLEWLSDNGSAYIARQTAQVAPALGIDLHSAPVRSPQSNGMSEALVKTLRRDYASTVNLPNAETILALLPQWIDDYCEVHPHSRLNLRSPREFLRLSA
jgi:putative transposase